VINPNGAFAEVLITDEGSGFNEDWNCVWHIKTKITDKGWFAEIAIPFSSLKFSNQSEQIWGINLERNIRRKNEQVLWQGWSRDYSLKKISQAGKLIGLKDIAGKKLYKIKPYITGGFEKETDEKLKYVKRIGGDFNYLVSPTMKLNFTLNTDFSQVESDKVQINLSRFSISYPEKRDFFLEGKDIFEFNVGSNSETFYTRRIGIHERKEVPIIGGARLTGKANKTNIGLLSIQTAQKDTLPTTNYSVIRLKQDVLGQSNIGMIVTAKNSNEHYNYVYGMDANYVTSRIFGDKNLKVGGTISQSITGNESNTNNFGYDAYLSFPNDFVEFDLSAETIQKDFNPEIGFLRRKNYTRHASELQLNPRPGFIPWINQMEIKPFELSYYLTEDKKKMESLFWEGRPLGFELKSGDFFEFNIQRTFDRLDESFEIIDDVYIPSGDYWYNQYEIQFESYGGRDFSMEADWNWGNFYTGKRNQLEFYVDWNLNKHVNISADWERNSIQLTDAKFITDEVGGRIEYEFSSKLYTSLFGQWNNEDDEIILNYRLNWLPKIGSYFYSVVNQTYSKENNSFHLTATTILAKLLWLF